MLKNNNFKKKILVADDDLGILEVIKIILEDKGYEVITIDDGSTILKVIEKSNPDLILLDIWMSGSDGRTITKNLKSLDRTKEIPVLIVSALTNIEEVAKSAHADGYIAKPFDIEDLLNLVEKHLQKN